MSNVELRVNGKPVYQHKTGWPRIGFFAFGGVDDKSYQWIDELGGLVKPDDVVIVAQGVSFDESGLNVSPDWSQLFDISEWLKGRGLHAVIRTTGDQNVAELAEWVANTSFGKEFRGVMMTYEAAQGSLDFTDPRGVDSQVARKEWMLHHAINSDLCHRRGVEFWSMPSGLYLSHWAARLGIPYGETAALCDGYVPQFQSDVKDGDLFEPRGDDHLTPWDRLKEQLYENRYEGILMPQAITIGGTLPNAITDMNLAAKATKWLLRDRVDGVVIQYQTNDEANLALVRTFLEGLKR